MSLRQWSLTWLRRRRARREPTSTEPASEACHSDQSSPAPSAPANAPGEAGWMMNAADERDVGSVDEGAGAGAGVEGAGAGAGTGTPRGGGRRRSASDAPRARAATRRRRRAREARHRERAETCAPGEHRRGGRHFRGPDARRNAPRTKGFAGRRDPISPRKAPDADEEDISSRHHNDAARDVGFAPAALAGRVASRRRPALARSFAPARGRGARSRRARRRGPGADPAASRDVRFSRGPGVRPRRGRGRAGDVGVPARTGGRGPGPEPRVDAQTRRAGPLARDREGRGGARRDEGAAAVRASRAPILGRANRDRTRIRRGPRRRGMPPRGGRARTPSGRLRRVTDARERQTASTATSEGR